MIILDTNVVSELMRVAPDRVVIDWVRSQPTTSLFTTTVTEAEILYGVALLPEGKRKTALGLAVAAMMAEDFRGRILAFDSPAARAFAPIAATRRKAGKPISQLDAQIAAIAASRDASVATRNAADFTGCEIDVINPWAPSPAAPKRGPTRTGQ